MRNKRISIPLFTILIQQSPINIPKYIIHQEDVAIFNSNCDTVKLSYNGIPRDLKIPAADRLLFNVRRIKGVPLFHYYCITVM
jgi:hypothetical protein